MLQGAADCVALRIECDQVKHVYMDEGSVMVASVRHVLKAIWTKVEWWLCTSHKLFGIGDIMKDHPNFGDLIEKFCSSMSVIKVPKTTLDVACG